MLKAGFAKTDITPSIGCWLTGFIARDAPSNGIDLPLEVRAIWIESGSMSAAIIAMDLVGISEPDADRIAGLVADASGCSPSSVLINSTHTHSGPRSLMIRGIGDAESEYVDLLARQVVLAVTRAKAKTCPVSAAWSSSPLKLGINRRVPTADGKGVTMGQFPSGPCDSTVRVLRLEGGPRPIVVMHHACHPYCISPAQTLISPDFCGYAVQAMARAGVDSLFINGCAGDITPLRSGEGQVAAKEEGERLSRAALDAPRPDKSEAGVHLWAGSTKVRLAYDTPPCPDQVEAIVASIDKPAPDEPAVTTRVRTAIQAWRMAIKDAMARKSKSAFIPESAVSSELVPQAAQVSLLRVGNGALAVLPGEPFFAIGLEIQKRINEANVAVAGYGHGFCGYVPTPDAYALGGYEVEAAHLYLNLWRTSPASAAQLVDAAVLLWDSSTKEIGP